MFITYKNKPKINIKEIGKASTLTLSISGPYLESLRPDRRFFCKIKN